MLTCPNCGKAVKPMAKRCWCCAWPLADKESNLVMDAILDGADHRITVQPPIPPAADQEAASAEETWEPYPATLARVRMGLGFHYARLLLILCSVPAVMVLILLLELLDVPNSGKWAFGFIAVVIVACELIGSLLCTAAPVESRAPLLILVSWVLDLASVVGYLLALDLRARFEATGDVIAVLSIAVCLARLLSWVFFVLFLQRLADYLGHKILAKDAIAILRLGLVVALGFIVTGSGWLGLMSAADIIPNWVAPLILAVGALITGLVVGPTLYLLVKQIRLLGKLRRSIWARI
jgi:hypothetical protein